MAQSEPECDVEAAEETNKAREGLPSPLRAEDDKIVSEMYNINDELMAYTFRLLEQCITLSDAVAEINQVNQRIKRT